MGKHLGFLRKGYRGPKGYRERRVSLAATLYPPAVSKETRLSISYLELSSGGIAKETGSYIRSECRERNELSQY